MPWWSYCRSAEVSAHATEEREQGKLQGRHSEGRQKSSSAEAAFSTSGSAHAEWSLCSGRRRVGRIVPFEVESVHERARRILDQVEHRVQCGPQRRLNPSALDRVCFTGEIQSRRLATQLIISKQGNVVSLAMLAVEPRAATVGSAPHPVVNARRLGVQISGDRVITTPASVSNRDARDISAPEYCLRRQ